jgi:uncharacterized membrane protein
MIRPTARALGWFSAGLGAVQILAPRWFVRAIGVRATGTSVTITRLIGIRELSVVPGLLTASAPVGWLAARVAGDVMDLALLGVGQGDRRNGRGRIGLAMAAVAGVFAVDVAAFVAARREARNRSRNDGRIVRSVTIAKPADELYRFWRDLENLPRVMPHLERVEATGGTTSHWMARAPLGGTVEWDAEITEDRPAEFLAWRSLPSAEVQNAGTVRFTDAPGGRGTEVTVEMDVDVPGGPVGTIVGLLAGEEPGLQVSDALRRFKQVMETGEAIRSDATADGRRLRQHPAQPPADGQTPDEQFRRRNALVAAGTEGDRS